MRNLGRARIWAAVVGVLLVASIVGAAPGRGDALPRVYTTNDTALPDGSGRTITIVGHLKAPAEDLFGVISDYAHYADLIPDITQVKIVSEQDGVVVARFRYFLLTAGELQITREFTHHPTSSIDFRTIEGNLGEMWGKWEFLAEPDTKDTKVTYTASLRPRFNAPEFVVKHILKSEAPKVMGAALEEVQSRMAAKARQGG
jgi:ribosome-associated toxin RatA of RatAB toxin-antitoxin module